MSYCVQCGVELARDLARCPLCQTEVLNPNQPPVCEPENEQPDNIEQAISRLDKGYARQLSVILMLIPMVVVLIIDVLDGGLTWSPFVIGALVMAWCFFVVPVVFRAKKPYLYITLDVLALCGYLALIAFMVDGFSWYLNIVLPLLVLIGAITLLAILVIRRVKVVKLYRGAAFFILLALFVLGLEIIVDLAVRGRVDLGWSVYSGIPLVVIALTAIALEQNKGLKEAIRKRLFI